MEKEFKASDLFDIKKGKRLTKADMIPGNIPFVGSSADNNGITARIGNAEHLHPGGTFTVSYNGSVGEVFLQDEEFWASDDVNVWYPKFTFNREIVQYIMAMIKKLGIRYGYTAKWTIEKMREESISLPVTPSPDPLHEYTPDDIDWAYMESYIAELEEERIAELDAYLQATGLDDCALTPEDDQALIEQPTFAEFKVGDVFKPLKLKKYAKVPASEGDVPFVSCKVTDNGIASYCGETPEVEHCITVSTNGNCFDCFWHDYPIVPSSDVEVLHLDGVTDNRERAAYICGVLAPNSVLYSYTNKPKNGKVFATQISLPVTPSSDPSHVYTPADIDWAYMERYIRAMEKLVMADVMAYKDRVIETTRQLTLPTNLP